MDSEEIIFSAPKRAKIYGKYLFGELLGEGNFYFYFNELVGKVIHTRFDFISLILA